MIENRTNLVTLHVRRMQSAGADAPVHTFSDVHTSLPALVGRHVLEEGAGRRGRGDRAVTISLLQEPPRVLIDSPLIGPRVEIPIPSPTQDGNPNMRLRHTARDVSVRLEFPKTELDIQPITRRSRIPELVGRALALLR